MKKISIYPLTDIAKVRIPNILKLICPFSEENGHYSIIIKPRKHRSFDDRFGQFAFLFNAFGGSTMRELVDYRCTIEDAK